MINDIRRLRAIATSLHRDTRGDVPIGPILLIGFIVVPLVLLLILFKNQTLDYVNQQWSALMGAKGTNPSTQ